MSRRRDRRPRLALTVGDPAGIGPEIVLRALASRERPEGEWVVYGPLASLEDRASRFGLAAPAALGVEIVDVGGGPFPSEQANEIGDYIRERGQEYGTTTRRPRRCGWFDAMAVRYSAALSGVTHVAMTLLDVLSGLEQVRICVGYKYRGQNVEFFRADMDLLAEVEPVYETMPGWNGNISGCRTFEELPKEAQNYVKRVEQLIEAPIRFVSVGPERAATLMR